MSARHDLLRAEDVRPRRWELAAFAVSLFIVALSGMLLRVQPDYVLTVEDSAPGRVVVATSAGSADLAVGDVVVVSPANANPDAAGTSATVVALDGATATILLDRSVDLGSGHILIRTPARSALGALVGRILG